MLLFHSFSFDLPNVIPNTNSFGSEPLNDGLLYEIILFLPFMYFPKSFGSNVKIFPFLTLYDHYI